MSRALPTLTDANTNTACRHSHTDPEFIENAVRILVGAVLCKLLAFFWVVRPARALKEGHVILV